MASSCQNLHLSSTFNPKKKRLMLTSGRACMNKNICSSTIKHPKYIPNKIKDSSYVRVLDTTLRDGEQTPGVNFSPDQKLEIARQLACLGVDIIEAGFPASSPEAAEVVKHIALTVGNEEVEGRVPVINAVSRCVKADIEASWDAVRAAKHPRIALFVATSEIHMKHKLLKTKSQVMSIMKDGLLYARSLGFDDVSFCAEDSSRSEEEFLYQVLEGAMEAGATTLILADTVGYMFPQEWARFTADVIKNVRGIENVVLSTHCHNDLGLATANALAAVEAGARQVEGTINGIGERAGNAALEEVEEYSGLALQANKAIDGVLKHRGTYEIMSPEDIGKSTSHDLGIVLGKYSGRHALQSRLRQLGLEVDDTKFEKLFSRFKKMAQNKKEFSDRDVKSLVFEEV
ncbi:hypothetical protein V2J09_001903 [Rumex salicifolius]